MGISILADRCSVKSSSIFATFSLAVAGDPKAVNVQNADITARFIGHLPALPFCYYFGHRTAKAFKLIVSLARAFGGIVPKTDAIGTDPNRSRVLNADALHCSRSTSSLACQKPTRPPALTA
jgi:hypothetical protein